MNRPHVAARIEDRWREFLNAAHRAAGWVPRVEPFTGYGSTRWVRVLGRVLMADPRRLAPTHGEANRRGWRYFFTAPAPREWVSITIGSRSWTVQADRGGYIDATVPVNLRPGWHSVILHSTSGAAALAHVVVIGHGQHLGVISDIDDTIMVTMAPRPLLAVWNTFGRFANRRTPVPGMAALYAGIAASDPQAPFIYLSNGAWNTAANLRAFLRRNGFPDGPLILTDWGPTLTGWFRNGAQHKHANLERLYQEFPGIGWLLFGDNGQRDPQIYTESAAAHPDHVAAVAIRSLTRTQQVLAGPIPATATPVPAFPARARRSSSGHPVPLAQGPDGVELTRNLAEALHDRTAARPTPQAHPR